MLFPLAVVTRPALAPKIEFWLPVFTAAPALRPKKAF
jgi:hypothetical protein